MSAAPDTIALRPRTCTTTASVPRSQGRYSFLIEHAPASSNRSQPRHRLSFPPADMEARSALLEKSRLVQDRQTDAIAEGKKNPAPGLVVLASQKIRTAVFHLSGNTKKTRPSSTKRPGLCLPHGRVVAPRPLGWALDGHNPRASQSARRLSLLHRGLRHPADDLNSPSARNPRRQRKHTLEERTPNTGEFCFQNVVYPAGVEEMVEFRPWLPARPTASSDNTGLTLRIPSLKTSRRSVKECRMPLRVQACPPGDRARPPNRHPLIIGDVGLQCTSIPACMNQRLTSDMKDARPYRPTHVFPVVHLARFFPPCQSRMAKPLKRGDRSKPRGSSSAGITVYPAK